jgi:hypothetical protein
MDAVAGLTTHTNIKDTLTIDTPISDIYTNANGQVVTVDNNGNETALTNDFNNNLIQDPEGNEYVVTSDGTVMGVDEFKNTGGNSRLMDNYNKEKESHSQPSVTFSASADQKYGFDAYTQVKSAIPNEYPELKAGYRPPFKSLISFGTDKVEVQNADKAITFRTETGIPATGEGSTFTVRGGSDGDETALYAYSKQDSTETVVGKLNLLSFDEQIRKVYIVSVNGAKLPSIYALQEELNRMYAPALTRWEVAQAKAINVTFPNGAMTHGGSNVISVYNADQKKVIKAFGEMEKDAYYLFFVNNVTNKNGIAGYMPLQYQSGFIYDNTQAVNIAHELAHGAFNLAHTFASPFIASEGQSDNLLDYNQNTALWKHQWKLVHNPQNLWLKFLQDEEEGEIYTTKQIINLFDVIRKNNNKKIPQTLNDNIIVRAIDIYQDKFIEDSAQYVSMTKEEFLSTLTHEQVEAFESRKTNDKAWDNNPIVLANKAHIKLKLDNKKDSTEFIVSVNGYSSTDKIFTAWITIEENNNKLTFYNATYAKSKDKIAETDIKSNRKAFDIIVHQSAEYGTLEELKTYLKIKGYIDFSDSPGNKIVLELNRKKSNDYVTIGELNIRDTDVKFLTLELGKSINNSSESTCSTKKHDQYLCGRIKAGTYKFELNTTGTAQHRYKSLRLHNVPGRDGILVHRGNAYLWTQGCILLMTANEIDNILEKPESFMVGETQGFNTGVEYQIPVLALYDYVEKYGTKEIKNKEIITGTIIITDDDNISVSNNNAFTQEINYRREAAQLYYDNEKSIQAILNNTMDSLMKVVLDEILLPLQKNIEKIDSIVQTSDFKVKVKEKVIRDEIISDLTNDLIKDKLSTVFAKIQSDKIKVIEKFFRAPSSSGPFPPIYWIANRYCKDKSYDNYDGKKVNSYIQEKITQKNIDDYINQQKEQYKK